MTVAVELKQDTLDPEHPHHVKELQLLTAEVPMQLETVRVRVDNAKMADSGTYKLAYKSPKDGKYVLSANIKANTSASQFR